MGDFSPFKRKQQLAESLKSDLKTTHTHTHCVIVGELGHTRLVLSVILDGGGAAVEDLIFVQFAQLQMFCR